MQLRRSVRVEFPGSCNASLAGIIDMPVEEPRGYLIFSHCFTCTKDIKAVVRISRLIAEAGYGVLRFDFTGLGDSHGDFAQTNFSTNRRDLLAAIGFLNQSYAPLIALIGLSLGGAAALSLAQDIPSVRAVATLAAPSDTQHLARLLGKMNPAIETDGEGDVTIGGKSYRITRQMVDDLQAFDLPSILTKFHKPLIVFHSPQDDTLGMENALRILALTSQSEGGSSLVCLPGADHLLVQQAGDIPFVAKVIAAWLDRYAT